MKKILLSIIFLLPVYTYSQFFQTGVQSEIPPLPESAVFRQFAGYTPSLNTGAANIPISLYDIQMGNFTLPISLQYYTSGIKVNDVAHPLGYGWSLNPGLRITRTVRGRADEGYAMKDINSIPRGTYNDRLFGNRALMKQTFRDNDDIAFDQVIGTNLPIDTKYDIFTIHLPSGNHSFIYKGPNNIESDNPLIKVKPIFYSIYISGFEVTDEKGIIYYFGCYSGETYTSLPPYIEKPTYSTHYTAWGLRKIKLPDGKNEINITWEQALTKPYFSQAYFPTLSYVDLRDTRDPERLDTQINDGNTYNPEADFNLRIKEIAFPLGKVTFNYRYENQASTLIGVNVSGLNNQTIKNITFEYNTTNTLLLTKLSMSDEGVYKFTYNPVRFKSIVSQDYWGYHNGKTNSSLIPTFKVMVDNNIQPIGRGADRSIDIEQMKANILTKVEYPTGGYTEFEYEPHQFVEDAPMIVKELSSPTKGRGLRVSKITTKESATSSPIIKTYTYSNPRIYNGSTLDHFFDRYYNFYEFFVGGNLSNTARGILRKNEIHAQSVFSSQFTCTPAISYSLVEEYTNDMHKVSYEFQEFHGDDITMSPRPHVHNVREIGGENRPLLKKTYYKKEGTNYIPIEETTYTYNRYVNTFQENYIDFCTMNTISSSHMLPYFTYGDALPDEEIFYMYSTTLSFNSTYLTKEEKKTYVDNNQIIEKTEYSYNGNRLLSEKNLLSSDDQRIKEEYSYLGQTSYPTLTKRTVNGVSESKGIDYHGGNKYLVNNIRLYKNQSNELRVTYHYYNGYGKPTYMTQDDATKVVYIWSYKGQYPIAEIKNATLTEVGNIISQATLNAIADAAEPTTQQLNLVNALRLQLPSAFISTYTYQPLVGIKSATDPSGLTTYYRYYNDGRLAEIYMIKDGAKISLERYDYNLVNSSTN